MKNKIIVMFGDEDKELNMCLYDYVEELYRHSTAFLINHVTEKEYETMLEQIKQGCLNERLPMMKREDIGYDKYRYMMAYNSNTNNIAIANYDDFEKIGSYVVDSNGLHFFETKHQFPKDPFVTRYVWKDIKLYTTETYQDLIMHYENMHRNVKITLSEEEVIRFEKAYERLESSVDPNNHRIEEMEEFKEIFEMILAKCKQ